MNGKRQSGAVIRDLALLGVLGALFAGVLAALAGGSERRYESLAMLFMVFLPLVLGFFTRSNVCLVAAGASVVGYAAFKLYRFYALGAPIEPVSYAWLVLPLLAAGCVTAFNYGSRAVERENEMLRSQVQDLVILDALTGQYNLRALYMELPRSIKQAERMKQPVTLMIVKMRYERELYAMLPLQRYQALLQRFAQLAADSVRLMDRTYVIDERGSMALLLACDARSAELVRDRVRANVLSPKAFEDVLDKNLRVETNIAYVQYDSAIGSPQAFKQRVESELVYDV